MSLNPVLTLTTPALAGATLGIIFVGISGWNRYRPAGRNSSPEARGVLESCPHYRRYLLAAIAAGGSLVDWDANVRAVLGELTDGVISGGHPSTSSASAEALLGSEMWTLIDNERAPCSDHSQLGPGRDVLAAILESLESTEIIASLND